MNNTNSNAREIVDSDSYISYESALYLNNCFFPTIYKTEYAVLDNNIRKMSDTLLHKIPRYHFFGFKKVDEEVIAEPEKALLDIIYRESKKEGNDYLHELLEEIEWDELSIEKIDEYSKRMKMNWRKYLPKHVNSRYLELAELVSKK